MWKPINFVGKRNKNLAGKLCLVPFNEFQIHQGGEVANCCPTWLPTFIGNIKDYDFMELLQTPTSKAIQNSMLDSSFSYCIDTLCPKIANVVYDPNSRNIWPIVDKTDDRHIHYMKPETTPLFKLFFNYDQSCNLQCPSCRNDLILYNGENQELNDIHQHVVEKTIKLLDSGAFVELNITGSGDPFASPLYWDFLCSLDGNKYPNMRITLQTNGVLMDDRHLEKLHKIYKNIKLIQVSIDASTEETYDIVRRNGNFRKLKRNLEHLNKLASSGIFCDDFVWMTNFIVSTTNYHEVASFAHWMLSYETIHSVWYNMIADWGHLSKDEFDKLAIWKESAEQHSDFLRVLADSVFENPKLDLGNMLHLRQKSLSKD